jgi:hypothetical protein
MTGDILVLDYLDRTGKGALETLARLVAEPGRPIAALDVHPNGVAVLRNEVDWRLGNGAFDGGLARGPVFLDKVATLFGPSSTDAVEGPYRVTSFEELDRRPIGRLTADGGGFTSQRRQDALRLSNRAAYAAGVPLVHLARCPFTGDLVSVPIDDAGLDGPFWDFKDPVHPKLGDVPATFLGFAGAMRVDEAHLENTPFVCVPGPDVPVVAPHLLMHPAVRAVLTAVWVGPHTGFVTTYFAEPGADVPHPWVARWGAKDYEVPSGPRRGELLTPLPPLLDAELTPWIASGKLAWIEPKDATLTARHDVDDCPWLGIPGSTVLQAVEHGRRLT